MKQNYLQRSKVTKSHCLCMEIVSHIAYVCSRILLCFIKVKSPISMCPCKKINFVLFPIKFKNTSHQRSNFVCRKKDSLVEAEELHKLFAKGALDLYTKYCNENRIINISKVGAIMLLKNNPYHVTLLVFFL